MRQVENIKTINLNSTILIVPLTVNKLNTN